MNLLINPIQLPQMMRSMRKQRKLTLDQAAKLSGLGKITINMLENSRGTPNLTTIKRLIEIYKFQLLFQINDLAQTELINEPGTPDLIPDETKPEAETNPQESKENTNTNSQNVAA